MAHNWQPSSDGAPVVFEGGWGKSCVYYEEVVFITSMRKEGLGMSACPAVVECWLMIMIE